MAGNTLYLGNLFNSLNGKIDQQITKVDQQITKLDSMITELQAIKSASSQSVSVVNLTDSNNLYFTVTHTEIYNTSPSASAQIKIKCLCNGRMRLKGNIKGSTDQYQGASLQWSGDLGVTWNGVGSVDRIGTYTLVENVITVENGKELWIRVVPWVNTAPSWLQANSIKLYADKKDIVNTSAMYVIAGGS